MAQEPLLTREAARRDHEEMLRFMAKRFALGLGIGWLCAALIFVLNIGGLATRVAHTDNPILPVFLIAAPMGLTFGAVVLCIAIWVLPYEGKFERSRGRDPF